jgi:hypothetical protein
MTLFQTLGASYHLRPDGSVWAYEWPPDSGDIDEWRWREVGPQEAAGAVGVAAKRLAPLGALVPKPDTSSPPCSVCHGSGRFTQGEGVIEGVWCTSCFGVGFLLDGAT